MFLNFQHLIEDAIGDVELAHLRQRNLAAIAQIQSDDVRVGVESGAFLRHVIRDNHVRALSRELAASILRHVIGLRGKTDQHSIAFFAAKLGENVRRGFQLQRESA